MVIHHYAEDVPHSDSFHGLVIYVLLLQLIQQQLLSGAMQLLSLHDDHAAFSLRDAQVLLHV
jgi:hypothetical protein